ncbi:oxysterol-binding protein-related protein 9/10/11, partial [Paragonimus westermani]
AALTIDVFTMEGPLSKWTNVVNGWQYRWFVLDFSVGILFYYTSKEKMIRGDRRGCVKLKNAQVGIDDEDDSTFTITVDHKTFHFQARDANERQKWLDALQEARDLHTQNYALIHQTNRLLDHPSSLSEFDRRIVEADAYLQILIDQQQDLSVQNAGTEECRPETVEAIGNRMQVTEGGKRSLIELVKKTIVCLQFARESMMASYSTVLTASRSAPKLDADLTLDKAHSGRSLSVSNSEGRVQPPGITCEASSFTIDRKDQLKSPESLGSTTASSSNSGRSGEGNGNSLLVASTDTVQQCPVRKLSLLPSRHTECIQETRRPSSAADISTIPPLNNTFATEVKKFDSLTANSNHISACSLPIVNASSPLSAPHNCHHLPISSYSSSEDDLTDSNRNDDDEDEFFDTHEEITSLGLQSPLSVKSNYDAFRTSIQMSANNQTDLLHTDDLYDELYDDDDEEDLHNFPHFSLILAFYFVHLVSSSRLYVRAFSYDAFRTSIQMSANNQTDLLHTDDLYDELYDDDDEEDLGSVQSQGSIITHLLSQLRIGMDLTRITLPTFILERRSTLEMYADFLAHADLWAAIPDATSPRDRMIACLRWYLSAFHAGRRSSIAKKPYNPILGEIFRCYWCLPVPHDDSQSSESAVVTDTELHKSGPVPWATGNSVVFLAEQVSHHPPISAFYAEHVGKRISLDGHLWTKSKFLGLSIAVEMVGSAVISLLNVDEEYVITFPCGYGRNILTVPWIELGGKTSIICTKSGYVASIEFKTKPFYGGKKDLIHAEVRGPNEKKPLLIVDGEWNDKMCAEWADGKTEIFVDTRATPVLKKQVLPRSQQMENESRRLWEQVTRNLKHGDIDAATDAKCRLEQRQRELARHRQENKLSWVPECFRGEGGNWIYRAPLIQRCGSDVSAGQST